MDAMWFAIAMCIEISLQINEIFRPDRKPITFFGLSLSPIIAITTMPQQFGKMVLGLAIVFGFALSACQKKEDMEPPVIRLKGSNVYSLHCGETFQDPGAIAFDKIDLDISDRIEVYPTLDSSQAGIHTINYKVEDNAGNVAYAKREIQIRLNYGDMVGTYQVYCDCPSPFQQYSVQTSFIPQSSLAHFIVPVFDGLAANLRSFEIVIAWDSIMFYQAYYTSGTHWPATIGGNIHSCGDVIDLRLSLDPPNSGHYELDFLLNRI